MTYWHALDLSARLSDVPLPFSTHVLCPVFGLAISSLKLSFTVMVSEEPLREGCFNKAIYVAFHVSITWLQPPRLDRHHSHRRVGKLDKAERELSSINVIKSIVTSAIELRVIIALLSIATYTIEHFMRETHTMNEHL